MIVTERAIERAGELLHRHIGLRMEPSIRSRLSRAIADSAGVAGRDPEAYVDDIARDATALQDLFDRVTVQETGFFRHPAHFEVLADHLLPAITGPVRIWSAACSNGQEPYSLAMVLAEAGVPGEVLATDVSSAAIRRTLDGRYSARELRGLSPARQAAHGVRVGTGWEVSPAIRQRVRVERRNLLGALPPEVATCQVVFVRNVLIYFTPAHASAFVERLAEHLPRGAHVFLGGAESMWHLTDRFEPVRVGGTFVYRLRDTTPAAGRRPAARPAGRSMARLATRPAARPAAPPRPAQPPRDRQPAAPTTVTAQQLAHGGLEAFASGDHAGAIQAFRRWAYLEPDDPVAHFHLGIAFEEIGDRTAANRAYVRSRALIVSGAGIAAVTAFGGYGLDDIVGLLDAKLGARR